MTLSIIAFCIGVASQVFLPLLPALGWCIGFFILLLIIALVSKRFKRFWFLGLFVCLGFGLANYQAHRMLTWHLPVHLINKPVVVEGQIDNIPTVAANKTSFNFKLTRLAGYITHARIRLNWYQKPPLLRVGEHWKLTVKLKPPHSLRNPGGFDYQRWLFAHHIRATGYVIHQKKQFLLSKAGAAYWIDHLREKIKTIIQDSVAHWPLAAILNTLTTGSKSLMARWQWKVFQNTGTSHLMAISGLHVGLISTGIYFLVDSLCRLFCKLIRRVPSPKIAAWVSLISGVAYGALAGFSLPTQRAIIMIVAFIGGSLFYRAIPLWRRLLLAFFVILIIEPFALWSASFWLSFLAIAWLVYGMAGRLKEVHKIKKGLYLQVIIFLGLMPASLFFFQQVSLVALFANVLAIPWIGMIIVPLCLLATLSALVSIKVTHSLFWLAAKMMTPLWWWLQWLAGLPHVVWFHAISSVWLLLLISIGALCCLAPRGWSFRYVGLLGILPLFFYRPAGPAVGAVWLSLLDVGEGLSAVVQTAHHVLIYDTGPRLYTGFDAGEQVLLPYLKTRQIQQIDTMVISHGDNDHIGGALSVLKKFSVGRILTSVPKRLHGALPCFSGQRWVWDGVVFQMLSPLKNQPYRGNNSSCVLRITAPGHRCILLTGDIEKAQEASLIAHHVNLKADVIVVPHHGSISSSSGAFIQRVKPVVALFPLGYYNRYHFPAPKVVARYRALKARVLSSANNGEIMLRIDPYGKIRISSMNDTHYFWQD